MKINTLKQTIVALLLLVATSLTAKEITQQQAQLLAQQFLTNNTNTTQRKQAPVAKLTHQYTQLHTNGSTPLYHIFNQAENGFIIIAGDDNIAPVIGYSDNGTFDPNNLPDNFKAFLEYCNQTIETSLKRNKKHNTQNTDHQEETDTNNFAPYVEPLLDDIAFAQSSPYNSQCPKINNEHTVVGCVALSMAQIMTYYQYPTQGAGSNTYTSSTNKIKLSVNFEEATYDWTKILHSYKKGTYTDEQVNEVAKLLFHCGVATNMDYGIGFSGSNSGYCLRALTQYFNYDKCARIENRDMHTQQEWENIIKKELNEKRPIIYAGVSAINGGHAFNCDGYDENDMFHINWGWGGYCNGYFNLRLLEPDKSAIEKQHNGYAIRQHIVVGIQPATENCTQEARIQLEVKQGLFFNKETNEIKFECNNNGSKTFSGEVALGIYNEENEFIGICESSKRKTTLPLLYTVIYRTNSLDIPVQKNYRIMPFYKENNSEEWFPIPCSKYAPSTLIADYLKDSTLIFKNTEEFENSPLQVISLKPIGNVYQKRTARFTAKVKNISNQEYYGAISVFMTNYDNYDEELSSEEFHVTLDSGEEAEYEIHIENINTSVGDYYCYIAYDSYDSYWTTIYGEYYDSPDVDFSVLETPTGDPKLTITKKLAFVDATSDVFFNYESPIVSTSITNRGEYTEIYVAAVILDGNKKPMHSFSTKKLIIDTNETAELSYVCDFNELTPGLHYLNLQYYNAFENPIQWKMLEPKSRNLLPFTITDGTANNTENTQNTGVIIYPTKTKDFINLTAEEEILNATIYNITGVEIKTINLNSNTATIDIQNLAAGIYLVSINTTNYTETVKIIKE